MQTKDILQLAISATTPFIAAAAALGVAAYQRRERIACIITWSMGHDLEGRPEEVPLLTIHNLTSQNVAVSRVRYLSGLPRRASKSGTALNYADPNDLDLPKLIPPGELRNLQLDDAQGVRLAEEVKGPGLLIARLLRRPRLIVEATTTTGSRRRIDAERALPWRHRAAWAREW